MASSPPQGDRLDVGSAQRQQDPSATSTPLILSSYTTSLELAGEEQHRRQVSGKAYIVPEAVWLHAPAHGNSTTSP